MKKKIYSFLIHFAFIVNLIFLFATTYNKKQKEKPQQNHFSKIKNSTTHNDVKDYLLDENTETENKNVSPSIN